MIYHLSIYYLSSMACLSKRDYLYFLLLCSFLTLPCVMFSSRPWGRRSCSFNRVREKSACRRRVSSSSAAAVRSSASPQPCQPPDLSDDQPPTAIERNLLTPSPSMGPGIVERFNRRPSSSSNRPFMPQVRHGLVGPDYLIDGGCL
jgi:hypothetical protein